MRNEKVHIGKKRKMKKIDEKEKSL